jgi:predicted nucleotidyltransferase component of viral defense system
VLTALQERLAEIFFSIDAAAGFVLAGGAALIATGVVDRATEDLDFFVEEARQVRDAASSFQDALEQAGLSVVVVRSTPSFVRMEVRDDHEVVLVDMAMDHRVRPAQHCPLGPVLAAEELAADKLLALFSRAEPRDFVDVFFLALHHGIDPMLRWAQEKDAGFDRYILATMIGSIDRRPREEFAVDDATLDQLRTFFWELRASLVAGAFGDQDHDPG